MTTVSHQMMLSLFMGLEKVKASEGPGDSEPKTLFGAAPGFDSLAFFPI